jgi:hypothetical protein
MGYPDSGSIMGEFFAVIGLGILSAFLIAVVSYLISGRKPR